MRMTIRQHGLEAYLNIEYHKYGGYPRFVAMMEAPVKYPLTVIGNEFGGVSRESVREWAEAYAKIKTPAPARG